ncbi:hypothetical protein BUALT_Bualt10G0115800 [Buddleja alternifolia]|uniref:Exoribonuclease phosphorolytic domain-containing protein n=1 Tax=Buddleja alternifolia TaxID=168488 RepID=A0AAV6X8W4_9LAMI|nr:hypothetical protein BUALT_Bualt10G0115800 [Buddleja alternifolia]
MDIERVGGRGANQLRPIDCSRNVLNRAHGSATCSHGETRVLAAVYGPKAGTKKNENPEKACFEVVWKPKTGQIGEIASSWLIFNETWTYDRKTRKGVRDDPEENIAKYLPFDCSSEHYDINYNPGDVVEWIQLSMMMVPYPFPVILPVMEEVLFCEIIHAISSSILLLSNLLPCAIHAACAALVDAGIPLKYSAVAISCCLAESGHVILDPSKLEEQKMKGFVCLAFPTSVNSILPESGESMEQGIITSLTHGVMTVEDYFQCLEQGRAAIKPLSNILKKKLQSQSPSNVSMAT